MQSGLSGRNRGSFQGDASKVPGCRNAKDVRPSPITTLRLWGTTLLCLLARTTTSLSTSATASSYLLLNHAITILLLPPTRIIAILPRVRAIVSRIVTTTVLARDLQQFLGHTRLHQRRPPNNARVHRDRKTINQFKSLEQISSTRSIHSFNRLGRLFWA